MLPTILLFGLAAGVIVVVPMFTLIVLSEPGEMGGSMFVGYLIMVLALSLIFIGVKRYRDRVRGGVIPFLPALLAGLGISAVAGVTYVIGWEITLALTNYTYASDYAAAALESARAKGASPEEIEKLSAHMATFQVQYANPLLRVPMTFVEIFPVGLLVSLISAALLRNSRFMPARR
ncbi:MAG: DUF4199 domain-containing protein [Hyphomonadaceae bacterium]|nr:DUF4199 domain-containing protein [Hyphomonadaceae bacterium]